jgi:putative aldouronate transport system permease protein
MLNPFFAMVMVSFFREMPNVLKESAKIDGANDLRIFFSLILPLSKPVLATIALFTSVLHWNSWLDAAYFIQTPKLKTMSYYMMEIINKSMTFNMKGSSAGASAQEALGMATSVTTKSIQMATIVVAVTPILLVYPFLQRYFIKGMMIGAVKG